MKCVKDLAKMVKVIFLWSTINQDVIKIKNQKLTNKRSQYMCHHLYKRARSIRLTKRHN